MQRMIWLLWPSFIVGGIAETVFFTLFDPMDLHLFGESARQCHALVVRAACIVKVSD
jgi:hypothetical protein